MSDVAATPAVKPRQGDNGAVTNGTGETVTVACKMPNGLILRNFVMTDFAEPVMGGGSRTSQIARQVPETYELHGSAVNLTEIGKGNLPNYQIAGGYGLTPGVPLDFWEKWLNDNRNSAIVKNNIVFAYKTEGGARDQAIEKAALKSGLEPLDPENLPRDLQRVRKFRENNSSDADNM